MAEGVIKFNCIWLEEGIEVGEKELSELNHLRNSLLEYDLIGVDANGFGYGNLSVRIGEGKSFLITGSQTAHLKELSVENLSLVTDYDIDKNELSCKGMTKASSESLTHAAIYQSLPSVHYVIHIHSIDLWQRLLSIHPTTPESAEYGTKELALAVAKLSKEVGKQKLLVLGGHREGIIFYGDSYEEILEYTHTVIDRLQALK